MHVQGDREGAEGNHDKTARLAKAWGDGLPLSCFDGPDAEQSKPL